MAKEVRSVTTEELIAARGEQPAKAVAETKVQKHSKDDNDYVRILNEHPQRIEDFFSKYDYIDYEYCQNPGYLIIRCKDFYVFLSNDLCDVEIYNKPVLDREVVSNISSSKEPEFFNEGGNGFNIFSFYKYCVQSGLTPEETLKDIVINDFMKKEFPSFEEFYSNNRLQSLNKTYANLSPDMQKIMKSVFERETAKLQQSRKKD